MEPRSLEFVPDKLKTEEMCNEAVRREPYTLDCVLDHLKTKNMQRGNMRQPSKIYSCS